MILLSEPDTLDDMNAVNLTTTAVGYSSTVFSAPSRWAKSTRPIVTTSDLGAETWTFQRAARMSWLYRNQPEKESRRCKNKRVCF